MKKDAKYSYVSWISPILIVSLVIAAIGLTAFPWSWAAETTMEVYQINGGKIFGLETSLDIFGDPKFGGEKIIAPFSEGFYNFAVYNDAPGQSLPYALTVEATNPGKVPIVISLKKNGDYIYGDNGISNMQFLTKLDIAESQLDGKQTDLYTLEWAWNTESDSEDTKIGSDGTQLYTIIITAIGTIKEVDTSKPGGGTGISNRPEEPGTETEPEIIKEPEISGEKTDDHEPIETDTLNEKDKDVQEVDSNPKTAKTGYDSYIDVLLIIMVACILLLLIMLLFKRRKTKDEKNKDSSEDM